MTGSSPTSRLEVGVDQLLHEASDIYGKETVLTDGVTIYQREDYKKQPTILWLVITKDKKSWGQKNKEHPARTFQSFLDLLTSTHLNLTQLSLGLLTTSPQEYNHYKSLTHTLPLAKTTIILHPGYSHSPDLTHPNRKAPQIQTVRRAELAKLRNYLMLKSLTTEPHIIWLDADIHSLSPNIIQTMLAHAQSRPDIGLLTARCTYGPNQNYDKNAWAGIRPPPPPADPASASTQTEHNAPQILADTLLRNTNDTDLIPLTAIGAAILYIRSSLIFQGLSFPHQYTVGTRWDRDGYDGLESEGLCYRARGLEGGGCYLLGGEWRVGHMIN